MSIHADKTNITGEESVRLTCTILSANGPRREEFKWEKNLFTIANFTDMDSSLSISTADVANPYGAYTCKVNNGIYEHEETVVISEKGILMR